ncbi:MAG: hypothetical protein KAZ91_02775 [Candidatus Fonsibacter sp.]|nr:hypothetical protein [Fluviicola sp.]MBP7837001.1 hypothetical protein [Candidatus Fonsibacter sp.]
MEKSIIYTESASKKIESILNNFKQRLEEEIKDSKNYPGEESIEITASDIEEIYERVIIRNKWSKSHARIKMIRLVLPIYFLMGIALVFYGFFRDEIQQLIYKDKSSLMYILIGFIISLTTGAMFYLLKQRESENKRDLFREKLDIEREFFEKEISKMKNENMIHRIDSKLKK